MKIRKLWAWGFAIVIGFLFCFPINQAYTKEIKRVDNDVGVEVCDNTDVSIDMITFGFLFDFNLVNEAEVEISPGDSWYYVSSTTQNVEARNETLLGSLYRTNNSDEMSLQFDNSNNTWIIDLDHNYETSTKTLNYNIHFRMSRSRLV